MGSLLRLTDVIENCRRLSQERTATGPAGPAADDLGSFQRARAEATRRWEARIPADYREAELFACEQDAGNREALEACRELARDLEGWSRSGDVVLLAGPVGTGKTFLAWALARAVVQGTWLAGGSDPVRRWTEALGDRPLPVNQVVFVDWLRQLEQTKASWRGARRPPSVEELAGAEWLVLDDIGAPDSFGEWAQGQLLAVVHERVQARRPTIVTTNLTLSGDPAERLDPRIVDRLTRSDRCWRLAVGGPSRRQRG